MKKNKNKISNEQMLYAFNHFYEDCTEIPHSRYKSWEYCKTVFNKVFDDIKTGKYTAETVPFSILDNLCLNLGFYLASWGMMRGSTDLLQRDYKIHEKSISVILKNGYLNEVDISDYDVQFYKNLENLNKNLEKAYTEDVSNQLHNVSQTLLTKIIMRTLGIVPAYDDFVGKALKYYDLNNAAGTYSIESLKKISEFFYQEPNYQLLSELQNKINTSKKISSKYTKMKIIDMVLWELGMELANFEKIWKKMKNLQGQELKSITGENFKYKINDEYFISLKPKKETKVHKDMIFRAYCLWPVSGPGELNEAGILAPSYLWSIFNDGRIINKESK